MSTNNEDLLSVLNDVKDDLRELQEDIKDILVLCTYQTYSGIEKKNLDGLKNSIERIKHKGEKENGEI
tara:strand:+ start:1989 stop:2192 length:204 start_codon:yes stop_codon:yes gene_type:complete